MEAALAFGVVIGLAVGAGSAYVWTWNRATRLLRETTKEMKKRKAEIDFLQTLPPPDTNNGRWIGPHDEDYFEAKEREVNDGIEG